MTAHTFNADRFMQTHMVGKHRIVIWHSFPPMPDRRFDYTATVDDGNEDGPVGHGATAVEAFDDLIDQLEDAT